MLALKQIVPEYNLMVLIQSIECLLGLKWVISVWDKIWDGNWFLQTLNVACNRGKEIFINHSNQAFKHYLQDKYNIISTDSIIKLCLIMDNKLPFLQFLIIHGLVYLVFIFVWQIRVGWKTKTRPITSLHFMNLMFHTTVICIILS